MAVIFLKRWRDRNEVNHRGFGKLYNPGDKGKFNNDVETLLVKTGGAKWDGEQPKPKAKPKSKSKAKATKNGAPKKTEKK